MNKDNLKDIFENIQDGTVLAFYGKKWTAKIITIFTREKKDENVPQHVAIVYEVKRNENSCSFKVSEQTFHGGRYRDVVINKSNEEYYTVDKYFLKQKFIEMFLVPMTQEQINLGIKDAISQIDKKYGYNRLIFGWEFLEKILPKEWQRNIYLKLNKKEAVRVCSNHVHYNLRNAGFKIPLDDFFTPIEIIKYIKKYLLKSDIKV